MWMQDKPLLQVSVGSSHRNGAAVLAGGQIGVCVGLIVIQLKMLGDVYSFSAFLVFLSRYQGVWLGCVLHMLS